MAEIRKSAAAYLLTIGLCVVALIWVLKLSRADLSVPLTYGADALLVQFWVKGLVENGWILRNGSVGAPFGLEMHDFPSADSVFLLILKAMSFVIPDYVRLLNNYYLLTFPLAALSALFVFRRFGAARAPAIVGSVLFAFLPYHFLRGEEHLFLASYFLVPLAVLAVLKLYLDGVFLFQPGTPGFKHGDPRTVAGLVLFCALMGSGGVYYAFFTCYLLLVAGASAAIGRGRLEPLRSAGVAVALISLAVLLNVAPKFLYAARHGRNPEAVLRHPAQAELLGLKLAQLVLPVSGHRVPYLARLKASYDESLASLVNENASSALGAVGASGFLALTAGLLLRRTRGARPVRIWDGLVDLNLAAVLLATFGGFGTLFGFLVTSWIRGYNRMSIFLAFFSLFAVVLALSRLERLSASRGLRWLVRAGLGALLVVGVLDQTTRSFAPKYARIKEEYQGDAEFVSRVEASLPPRGMVFQLPYSPFPEPTTVHRMSWYDHLRGYLHSRALRWSYGAMRGRYADLWQAHVAGEPVDEMVRRLAFAGFDGIYIDRAGFLDVGAALEAELTRRLGTPPMLSRNGRFSFFRLTDHAQALRQELTPAALATRREAALFPVLETWGHGFYGREEDEKGPFRWSDFRSEIALTNASANPRRVELAMTLSSAAAGPSRVRLSGPGWGANIVVEGAGRLVRQTVVVPPGTSRVKFVGNGPTATPTGDTRPLVFRVSSFSISEPASVADTSRPEEIVR